MFVIRVAWVYHKSQSGKVGNPKAGVPPVTHLKCVFWVPK